MNHPEILAPAGSMESLTAALRCGADAVYLGGKAFSARQRADNFALPALRDAIQLCHLYGAKLYLTVNTMILEQEFAALIDFLDNAVTAGVDALIVQDLGALSLIRKRYPRTALHASTQMTIHTPEGAHWAKEQGLTRVVTARELSRDELVAICRCDIEVEHFVHGALCMCVSGQCGLSAMIGSRSANRGRCAQACRLPFSAVSTPDTYALSLKDLCLVPHIAQLMADGVTSLKIEGRCKRPEYVAAAVTALVQARAGKQPDLDSLRAVFSRSGFTDGYYTGKRQAMFGIRKKEDVLLAKDVLPRLEQLYRKPGNRVPLSMHITVQQGQPVQITANDHDGHQVELQGEMPLLAKTKPTDLTQLTRQMEKLGDTIYWLETITADCDGISMLPASAWNALRRACVEQMNAARIAAYTPRPVLKKEAFPLSISKAVSAAVQQRYRIMLSDWDNSCAALLAEPSVEFLLIPVMANIVSIPPQYRGQVLLTLPRFCPDESQICAWLKQANILGFSHLLCENAAHLHLGKRSGWICHTGMGFPIANQAALAFLQEQGVADAILSPELTTQQTQLAADIPYGVYAYGYQPVMVMRNCPIQSEVGCRQCTHALTDRTGRKFPVRCHPKTHTTTLYNAVPTWMADKQTALAHLAFLLLDCSLYGNAPKVLHAYLQKQKAEMPITRGLFYRGVQ